TGNSLTSTTFVSGVATAYANNTGGVWNFETAFSVSNGDTITLNYGASLSGQLVMTMTATAGQSIETNSNAGEATSGNGVLALSGGFDTRTFTLDTPLLTLGIFNTDRGDSSRLPVLTVTFQDTTTASTSGAHADEVFFHGLSGTLANPIVSFSISQNNFVRYDDLGFVVAVPEPSS